MRAVAGTLKIDLAQFRELEAFATFGSELDKISQAQLDRGYRLTELLKQGLNEPLPVEEQVLVIYAGTKGHVDGIAIADVQRFERELRAHFRARHADLLETIRDTGQLPPEADMDSAIEELKVQFAPVGDEPAASGTVATETAKTSAAAADSTPTEVTPAETKQEAAPSGDGEAS
jgi:F-type H+-transporting ATPase subunit alpha